MAQCRPVLYSYFRSSCSWRVRIALAYKQIDFEYRAVNLLTGEQESESFLKVNSLGQIPVLVDKGNTILSSGAILEYLEEAYPSSPPLLPKDPALRAQVRGIVDGIISGIQPLQNLKVLKHVGENSTEWANHWVVSGFQSIEKILQNTRGKFCCGDEVTLADVCLVPQVFNAARFNVDMSQFPAISDIASRLNCLKAFKDTHPLVQPDCPENLRVSS